MGTGFSHTETLRKSPLSHPPQCTGAALPSCQCPAVPVRTLPALSSSLESRVCQPWCCSTHPAVLIAELALSSVLIHSCSSRHGHCSALTGVYFASHGKGAQRTGILLFIVLLPSSWALTDKHWQNLCCCCWCSTHAHPSVFCIKVNNLRHHNFSEVALGYSLLSQ